jgi:rubrerythrin
LDVEPVDFAELLSTVTDTISRKAVIDALDKRFDSIPIEQTTEILLLRKDLRDLPAAEPQRIKGKWALQSDDYHEYYECDQCGIAVGIDDIRNFCPNCGADMRER